MICCRAMPDDADSMPVYAEEADMLSDYVVTDGTKEVMFSYPAACSIEDEDILGVIVRLRPTGIIVNVTCTYGAVEVYDVLLTIVDSLLDAESFETWLTDEWLPLLLENK